MIAPTEEKAKAAYKRETVDLNATPEAVFTEEKTIAIFPAYTKTHKLQHTASFKNYLCFLPREWVSKLNVKRVQMQLCLVEGKYGALLVFKNGVEANE